MWWKSTDGDGVSWEPNRLSQELRANGTDLGGEVARGCRVSPQHRAEQRVHR